MSASSNNGRDGGKKPTYRKASAADAAAKESSSAKDARGAKDMTAGRDAKDAKDAKAEKDAKAGKAGKESAAAKDAGNARDGKDAKPAKDAKASSGGKHAAHAKGAADKKASPAKKDATGDGKSDERPRTPEVSVKKHRRPVGVIVAAALVAVLVAVGVGFGIAGQGDAPDAPDAPALDFSDAGYNDAGELINPVDWDEWVGRNPDVYAWLQIDGTKVDHPILQHPVVDDYYLMRNIDGEPEVNGTLYTQVSHNGKDLEQDPVTIVYGHTFEQNDTMFTTLHNLEDPDAFEATPTFYVYTPEKRLEYEIVSAFEYDNSHILEANDMTDPAVRAKFFDMVQNPSSINQNVRELESALDPDEDRLLVLSTCTQPANDNARYLVVAVLRDVESTENVDLSDDEGVLEEHVFTQEELDALADVE